MKYIKLTKNKIVLVDDIDFDWLNSFKWFYSGTYAKRVTGTKGHQKQIPMHRFIMNPPKDMQVDHINGDRLDYRRENLRICTPLENQRNKKSASKSGYRGVSPASNNNYLNPWRAFLGKKFLGYFKTAQEAAKAYNQAAKQIYGEFARLNQV